MGLTWMCDLHVDFIKNGSDYKLNFKLTLKPKDFKGVDGDQPFLMSQDWSSGFPAIAYCLAMA